MLRGLKLQEGGRQWGRQGVGECKVTHRGDVRGLRLRGARARGARFATARFEVKALRVGEFLPLLKRRPLLHLLTCP